MSSEWLNAKTKSLLAKTVITVIGNKRGRDVPINLTIEAVELNYAPLINITITSDVPFSNLVEWDDHPFMHVKEVENGDSYENIIDDTAATRAIIDELVKNNIKKLYTTTNCTHVSHLINAISHFWS